MFPLPLYASIMTATMTFNRMTLTSLLTETLKSDKIKFILFYYIIFQAIFS
jgi:hypothetical protein